MTNELENGTVADVSSEQSSAAPSETTQTNESPENQSKETKAEKYVPYERFQEIIKQRNDERTESDKRLQAYEARLKSFEERMKPRESEAPKKAENPLLGRLKSVDPEFGSWAEKVEAAQAELQELRQWRSQAEAERSRNEAQTELSRLHTEYKIPDDLKETYRLFLKEQVAKLESERGALSVKDLAGVYKSVHETIGKAFESRKRAEIANYTSSKKADSAPAVKKGAPTKTSTPTKFKYSNDREEAKAQILKQVMTQARAAKNI